MKFQQQTTLFDSQTGLEYPKKPRTIKLTKNLSNEETQKILDGPKYSKLGQLRWLKAQREGLKEFLERQKKKNLQL